MQKGAEILGVQGSPSGTQPTRTAEGEVAGRVRELSLLKDLAREMGAGMSVEAVLTRALEYLSQAVAPDFAMIFVKDGGKLICRGVLSGAGLPVDPNASVHRVGECLCGLSVEQAKPIHSRNVCMESRCPRQECKEAGLCSFIALPLMGGGELLGAVGLASTSVRDYEQQILYLEALTNGIAAGLRSALLYEQTQADALELEARLTRIREAEQEQAQLAIQLQQVQKMEAIGILAGGIAHDFNNILTPIIMGAEMIVELLPERNPARSLAKKVVVAGERAKELVSQILTFSRQSELKKRPLRLTTLVKETIKLARATLPATIEIRQFLCSEEDQIIANPTQIHQVLVNLITNAAHAMRKTGGVLELVLENILLNEEAAAELPELGPGRFIRLMVRDTGHGMSDRVLQQIFDPFFTTKKGGEGTGLGLPIVHGIVRSYHGAVRAESRVGEGTVFTIYLPSLPRMKNQEQKEVKELPRGRERILMVDDESDIVDVAVHMLDHLGYCVRGVTDARKALEIFSGSPDSFDLVITDLTMPKLTGDKLAFELRRIRPDIPIILCSGYSEQIGREKDVEQCVSAFLTKPIGQNLPVVIREVLSGRPSSQ